MLRMPSRKEVVACQPRFLRFCGIATAATVLAGLMVTVETAITAPASAQLPPPPFHQRPQLGVPILHDEGRIHIHGRTLTYVPVTFGPSTESWSVLGVTTPDPGAADTGTSVNWTGFVGNGDYDYTAANLEWTEPHLQDTSVTRYSVIWPGLGSGDSTAHTLAQAGTEQQSTSTRVTHSWWYEFYPQESMQAVSGLAIAGGDQVTVSVIYLGSEDGAMSVQFDLSNLTTGQYTSFTEYEDGSIGTQADAIVERPLFSSGFFPLTNFGMINASGVSFEANSNYLCIAARPNTRIDMYDEAGEELAYSRYSDSDGYSFTTTRTGND
jgi:hypothetical protein